MRRIEEKKKRLDALRPLSPEVLKNLEEWFTIELTYTSNAIEGNTLTRQETALVVEKGLTVSGKSLREHLEAVNHVEALAYIQTLAGKKRFDIGEREIREIHRMILHRIDDGNAGIFRRMPVRIAGSRVVLPNPLKVPSLIEKFLGWLHGPLSDSPILIAADAHYKLVSIHPFSDGNGRTARLLMNLLLLQKGYPPALIRKEDRLKYLDALEKCDLHGTMDDFYEIICEAVIRSLNIYLEAIEQKEERPPRRKALLLKIGEVSKMSGESVPTIRFWTKEGLLYSSSQTPGGFQLFSEDALKKIKEIRRLQKEKRLAIREIREIFQKK
ncbi:MAG: Fic family protein [bacterium]